jgi:AcrR family transcriptional regulator
VTTARGSTREAIVSAALELFRERGFEGTTMRAVAERAGVSVGNAYYYFSSKDELVQGFYDQLVAEHRALALPELVGRTDLADRLREMGVESLVVTGTVTQICVEETAREAFHHGFRTTLVEDAVSSYAPDLHAATLKNFAMKFGWVASSGSVCEALA